MQRRGRQINKDVIALPVVGDQAQLATYDLTLLDMQRSFRQASQLKPAVIGVNQIKAGAVLAVDVCTASQTGVDVEWHGNQYTLTPISRYDTKKRHTCPTAAGCIRRPVMQHDRGVSM